MSAIKRTLGKRTPSKLSSPSGLAALGFVLSIRGPVPSAMRAIRDISRRTGKPEAEVRSEAIRAHRRMKASPIARRPRPRRWLPTIQFPDLVDKITDEQAEEAVIAVMRQNGEPIPASRVR